MPYAQEIRRLAWQGCACLRIGDTSLAYLSDPRQRAYITKRGEDAGHMHLRYTKPMSEARARQEAATISDVTASTTTSAAVAARRCIARQRRASHSRPVCGRAQGWRGVRGARIQRRG